MIVEFNSETADEEFDEMPEVGDEIKTFKGESIITAIGVVNESKLLLKAKPKKGVRRFDDYTDHSVEWDELPDKFLEEESKDSDFVDNKSFIND